MGVGPLPIVSEQKLLEFSQELLKAGGANEQEASIVATSLVGANLRGHDSHGVMRIPFYLGAVREGRVVPGAELKVENESPAVLVCDGGWGFGQVLARSLMTRLMRMAGDSGIACGTLRRAAHIGRLGEYVEMAAEQGQIAIVMANTHGSGQRVAPVGGKRPRLGTNPICIGVPGGAEGPFVLDFGTSATAEGKVRVKRIAGQPVPAGWILDPDGQPTTDPNQLYGDPPGTILPMGGQQAYKGFGLAFMIELLCGGLTGGPCSFPSPPPPVGNCATFIVLDPRKFAGTDHLSCEVKQFENYVRGVPLIDGVTRVTLPGDPEREAFAARNQSGIPLDDGNWNALTQLASELGVDVPTL